MVRGTISRRLGLALLAALPLAAAWAQEPAAAPDVPPRDPGVYNSIPLPPEAEPKLPARPVEALQTVTVTARRKDESAQDVPISLTVLDGNDLAKAGLSTPQDFQERVPGLVFSSANPRNSSYAIRGLGSISANDGIESSVGIFLDGVYLGRQGLSVFDLVDLDRIEVLRGPQGTLFGKNTTAGALNIVTSGPTQDFEAMAEGSYGNYADRRFRGSVSGPLLKDTLSGRLTAYLTQRDGTITNLYNGQDLNNRNRYGLRGQLLWMPLPGLRGRFIAEYSHQQEHCCVYPMVAITQATLDRDAYMEYQREPIDPYNRAVKEDTRTDNTMNQQALSAQFDWTINPHHKLTAIGAFRHWTFDPVSDDYTSMQLVPQTGVNDRYRELSQEIRLTSSYDSFDSVAGVYFLSEHTTGDEQNILGQDLLPWTFGGLLRQAIPFATYQNTGLALNLLAGNDTLAGMDIHTETYQEARSIAGFGSVNWHLRPDWDLTTGVRYTDDSKHGTVSQFRTGGNPSDQRIDLLLDVLRPALYAYDLVEGTDYHTLTWNSLLDSIAGGDYARDTRYGRGNISGQLSTTYHFNQDLMVFASAARGYKAGGINLGTIGADGSPSFKPEEALDFELGLKSQFWGHRGIFNVTAYQTSVSDYQALTFDATPTLIPNPRQINVLNVGRVRLRGGEIESRLIVLRGLMVRAGLAYNQAITTSFHDAPDAVTKSNTADLSGQRLYNAPLWTASAGVEYGFRLANGWKPYAGVDHSFRSGYFGTVEHGPGSYVSAYSLTNARLGLSSRGSRWDVSLWVRNVFDSQYLMAVYPIYGVGDYGAVPGDPRTYGATLRLKF
jgi:iron complex outermembrane receptor protein